jgi:hypothetical protein
VVFTAVTMKNAIFWEVTIPSTTLNPISKRSFLMLSVHLRLGFPSGLFPSGFHTNELHTFFFSPHSCHISRPHHPPRLYNFNYTWRRVQIMQILIMQFPPPSRHSIPHGPNISSALYSQTPSVYIHRLMSEWFVILIKIIRIFLYISYL